MLMDAIWPRYDTLQANTNLKTAVHALRKILDSAHDNDNSFEWIIFQNGCYMINAEVKMLVDVHEFEGNWKAGIQLEKESNIEKAIKKYEAAESLYEGDYLEEDLYEEWTLLRRETLKDIFLSLLGRLANCSMQKADYERCIAYCYKILLKDHCREDIYNRLMCCYSRLKQRSTAIGWYRLCEKILRTELNVSPNYQTLTLYRKLLKDEQI